MRPILLALALCAPARAARLEVKTDPRLELAGALQLLADRASAPEDFAVSTLPYASELRGALRGFEKHPAVRLTAAMRSADFGTRAEILLRRSALPGLSDRLTLEYELLERAGGAEAVHEWLGALAGLARASDFAEAAGRAARRLAPALKRFRARERARGYVESLEEYAGLPLDGEYAAYLSPFHRAQPVANLVSVLKDGSMSVASVFGPVSGDEFWGEHVPRTLWHESAHGILDGLGDLFEPQLAASGFVAPPGCRGDRSMCVKEHVALAVGRRMLARAGESAPGDETLGFPHVAALERELEAYEKDRKSYPTLADYYPKLLAVFPRGKPHDSARSELSSERRLRLARLAKTVLARAKTREAREAAEVAASEARARPRRPVSRSKGAEEFLAGRHENALREFEAELARAPMDPAAHLSRAVALQALGRRDEALAAYERAVELSQGRGSDPEALADALSSRAGLLGMLGRRDEARADLSRALAVAPADWPKRADAERRLGELQ